MTCSGTGNSPCRCVCIKKEVPPMAQAENLTGCRFGRLTVLQRAENRHGRTCWLCRCDCGNTHVAAARDLKAGKVTSCGCRRWQQQNADLPEVQRLPFRFEVQKTDGHFIVKADTAP